MFPSDIGYRTSDIVVDTLAAGWDPAKYTDEYNVNLMRVINAKVKGRPPKLMQTDHGPKQAEVVDLAARLRASLEGKDTKRAKHTKVPGSAREPAASKAKKHARGRKRVA